MEARYLGERFSVGDIVYVSCHQFEEHFEQEMATIINIKPHIREIGLEFFRNIGGHTCGDLGKSGHCWWFSFDEIYEMFHGDFNINRYL